MSKRRGCGCFSALLLAIVIVLGTAAGLFFFAQPATFGIAEIGGYELGDLRYKTFYQLVRTLRALGDDASHVVTNPPAAEDRAAFADSSDSLGLDTDEGLAGLLDPDRPAVGTRLVQETFREGYFAVLLQKLLGVATGDDPVFGVLKELDERFAGEGRPGVSLSQVILAKAERARVSVTVGVNTANIRGELQNQLPGFLKNWVKIGDTLYLTFTDALAVDQADGTLSASPVAVSVNDYEPAVQELLLQILFDQINAGSDETYTPDSFNQVVGDAFCTVVNNLGKTGFYDVETARSTYTPDALQTGSLTLITPRVDE